MEHGMGQARAKVLVNSRVAWLGKLLTQSFRKQGQLFGGFPGQLVTLSVSVQCSVVISWDAGFGTESQIYGWRSCGWNTSLGF